MVLNTKQKRKAFNHEDTKGEEGKSKAITLLFKFFSFSSCSLCSGFVVACVLRSKSTAINHEGTKGEEGKVKIYVSNKHYFFSFRLCSLMHFGVYLQRISP